MRFSILTSLTLGLALLSQASLAHHSTAVIYDQERTIEITGTIKEWRFVNPHPSMIVEVEEADGQIHEWDLSYGGLAVPHLQRRGYTADTFQPGERIRATGFPPRLQGARGIMIRETPESLDGKEYPR